jgi:hypothetical protein
MANREATGELAPQGQNESCVYAMTVDPAPASVIGVYVFDEKAPTVDIKATHMPSGAASIAGSIITLPALTALVDGHAYRIEVRYSDGAQTLEPYFIVYCER